MCRMLCILSHHTEPILYFKNHTTHASSSNLCPSFALVAQLESFSKLPRPLPHRDSERSRQTHARTEWATPMIDATLMGHLLGVNVALHVRLGSIWSSHTANLIASVAGSRSLAPSNQLCSACHRYLPSATNHCLLLFTLSSLTMHPT